MVEVLLEAGTNLAFVSARHQTPLEIARATEGQAELVALLEARGAPEASPELVDVVGAAARGFQERALELVGEAHERDQRKALETAIKAGHADLARALGAQLSEELKVAGLCTAADVGHLELIDAFLELGAPINALPGRDYPALLYAARRNRLEAAKHLLARGADPNVGDYRDETPLHIAAEKNRLEMVELLLDHGANPKAKCRSGRTPLRVANEYSAKDTAALLKQRSKPRSKRAIATSAKQKLANLERAAFKPKTSKRKKLGAAESRLGGLPALAPGEAWPVGASGEPLDFICQLDLAIVPPEVLGPGRAGLVQLFFSGDTNEHLVRLVPADAELVMAEPLPNRAPHEPRLTITGWLKPKEDWPHRDSAEAASLDAEEREALEKLNLPGDKAGGWPHWIQGGGVEKSASGVVCDRLLLQLDAGGKLPYTFGDNGIAFLLASSSEPTQVAFTYQTP